LKNQKKTRTKSKVFVLRITDKDKNVLDVLTSSNYDSLMIEGMELAKEKHGQWTIFYKGREIDGSK